MNKDIKLKVPRHILAFCNELLNSKFRDPQTEENPYSFTVNFNNGIEVDIKVVNASPPYVDAVLFDDGFEVMCLEPDAETLDGEYIFDLDGTEYRVEII